MESLIQHLLSGACGRPRHLRVDQWYESSTLAGVTPQISYRPSRHDKEILGKQKANRRLEQWWHKGNDYNYPAAPSSEKLAEAKKQRFTSEGKSERISKSLTALSEPSRINLTSEQWRQIAEDPDLEEQAS
jgi:hypothetical protein